MVTQDDGPKLESRPPTIKDLVHLCRELNRCSAKYIVIGGMAVIQAGFLRATEDIDLLLEVSPQNQERVKTALLTLPDKAVRDVRPDDLTKYMVVRVADEFVVDLMASAGGMSYEEASKSVTRVVVEDVEIPFATPELLWDLKQTMREKDKLDLMFLKKLLRK